MQPVINCVDLLVEYLREVISVVDCPIFPVNNVCLQETNFKLRYVHSVVVASKLC